MEHNEELDIDLIDLLVWLLHYWYIFVIMFFLGCILGGTYSSHKNATLNRITPDMRISEAKENLTPREIKDVEDIVANLDLAMSKRESLAKDMNSSSYSGDDLEDIIKCVDYWNSVYNQQNSKINSLSKEMKKYYDALTADPDKAPEYESVPQFAIIGGIGAICLIGFCLCGFYVLTPTIKTSNELTTMYHYPVLMHLDNKENEISVLATDISILLQKSSLTRIAILYNYNQKAETA